MGGWSARQPPARGSSLPAFHVDGFGRKLLLMLKCWREKMSVKEQRLQWSANVVMAPFRHGAAVSSGGGGALSIQKGRFSGLFTCLSRLRRDVSSGSYRLLESCYQKSASVSANEHSDFALSLGGKKAHFTNTIHPSDRWLQIFFSRAKQLTWLNVDRAPQQCLEKVCILSRPCWGALQCLKWFGQNTDIN